MSEQIDRMSSYLPYHEPNINTLLLFTSFILLLNVINHVIDTALYCGLVGQIAVGVAFGTPGAKWLPDSIETVLGQLGYIGLILIVFEGKYHCNSPGSGICNGDNIVMGLQEG